MANRVHVFLRVALIGALVASLGLAACGRKGPLDPPPGASLQDNSPQAAQPTAVPNLFGSPAATPIGGRAQSNDAGVDERGRPLAPKGEKKSLPIDVLLN